MTIELITGHAGKPHVSSDDQGAFLAAAFGKDSYVLDGLDTTVQDANTVSITQGNALIQGRHVRVFGAPTEVKIASGQVGQKRYDIIYWHYTKNPEGIESIELLVERGTASADSPQIPSVTKGNILSGSEDVQVPFAQILIDGITPKLDKMLVEKWGEIKEYQPRNTYGSCNITIYKYKRIAIMNGTISGITDTELWTDKPIAHIDNKEFLPAILSKGGGTIGNQWWNKTVPVGPEVNEKGDIALSYKLGDKVVSGNFFIIYFTK